MKKRYILVVLFLTLILGLSQSLDFHDNELETEEGLWALYERWRSHHTVSRSLEEKLIRFNVFKHNVIYINNFNKEDQPYKLKLNKFADMTNQEFRTTYATSKINHRNMLRGVIHGNTSFMYENVSDVPASMDWRKDGVVNPVKDQGQCGSCWAFSTIASVEGINAIKTKQLVSLSEQELVDCDTNENQGCNGGIMDLAFDFIKQNGGIATEASYPYNAQDGKCDASKAPAVTIDGHEDVPPNNEDALLKAVANQPVSVAIDASGYGFQFYSRGVFTGVCGTELDHGVNIVGYGTSTLFGTKYWIVRNSWGAEWGEQGYIRIQRGIRSKNGKCGIAMMPSYPIKNSATNHKGSGSTKDEL